MLGLRRRYYRNYCQWQKSFHFRPLLCTYKAFLTRHSQVNIPEERFFNTFERLRVKTAASSIVPDSCPLLALHRSSLSAANALHCACRYHSVCSFFYFFLLSTPCTYQIRERVLSTVCVMGSSTLTHAVRAGTAAMVETVVRRFPREEV